MENFEPHRQHLFGVAYRMLGSAAEAEDAVQESFLRWQQRSEPVESARAFLTTVVTRLCLDRLKSARTQRETYPGPWLPEPISAQPGPDHAVEMAESLSLSFLLLLQRLTPVERAVFLLREVFGYSFEEISGVVQRSPENCRQVLHRARQSVQATRIRFQAEPSARQRWTERFLQACHRGDMQPLLELLSEEVTVYSDGGGKVTAAIRPIQGRDKVLRFLLGLRSKRGGAADFAVGQVNGQPALIGHNPPSVVWLDHDEHGICAIHILVNPDKLSILRRT